MPITLKEQKGNLTVQPPYMATSSGGSGVSSVNGQTGRVVLDIPSKVSELENDLGYLTEHQSLDALATKEALNNGLAAKQDKLTAGENITIQNNVISASGGSSLPTTQSNFQILYYKNNSVQWETLTSIFINYGLDIVALSNLGWKVETPTSSVFYNAKELAFIIKNTNEEYASFYYNFRYFDDVWNETTLGQSWSNKNFYCQVGNSSGLWYYNGSEFVFPDVLQPILVAYKT